jgi:hypothetical protein
MVYCKVQEIKRVVLFFFDTEFHIACLLSLTIVSSTFYFLSTVNYENAFDISEISSLNKIGYSSLAPCIEYVVLVHHNF